MINLILHSEFWHVIVQGFDRLVPPDTEVDIGSGGGSNFGSFTFPPEQDIPDVSFLNFEALQYMHNLSIFPITTLG